MLSVMDIETYEKNGKTVPYCVCIKINDIDYSFWGTNSILEFIQKISLIAYGDKIVIYTHNINFDGLIILEQIKTKKILYDILIRESNIYWIKIWYAKVEILVRCSYKIIPLSVDSMGLLIQNKKKIFPYKFVNENNLNYIGPIPDFSQFNSKEEHKTFCKNNSHFDLKKTAISYCFQDIHIVYEVLKNILHIIKLHSFGKKIIESSFSFSSIAYKIFSSNYDEFAITQRKNNKFEHEYYKNAYYGGRCEVFGNQKKNELIHYFDFKGMYAQCMLEKFPTGSPKTSYTNLDFTKIGFHTIKFKCENDIPFLPVKNNKLLFPKGVIVGTYWYEEIINAIRWNKCEVLEHYSSYTFEEMNHTFKNYVQNFLKMRDKGKYYKIFGKNMNNGLYGSFALNENNSIYVVCFTQSEFSFYENTVDIINFSKIGEYYIINIGKNKRSEKLFDKKKKWNLGYAKRNIAYAAIIASKARIKINNSLEQVKNAGYSLYYCDTDSIYAGKTTNNLGSTIGEVTWSQVYNEGIFISSKFYYIKNEPLKLKGVTKNSFSYEEIKEKFLKNNDYITFDDQLIL